MHVDPKRVSLAGMSNGGLMTLRMLCRQSQEFYSYSAVAASLGESISKKCTTKAPFRLLLISGDKDPLMPYAGGQVTGPFGFTKRGKVSGIDQTMLFFRSKLNCDEPEKNSTLDIDSKDGLTTELKEYVCEKKSRIKLMRVRGGGHTWPSGQAYLPEKVIGKNSRDFSASKEIANFLKEQE
jgi:polyhydroxybutyrate depolymerase